MTARVARPPDYLRRLAKLPGPPAGRMMGNALELMREYKQGPQHFWGTYVGKLVEQHGPLVRLLAGDQSQVLVADHQVVKEIVRRDPEFYVKGAAYDGLNGWLDTSILMSEGDVWRRKRQLYTRAFTPQALKNYVDVFRLCGERLSQHWEGQLKNGSLQTDVRDSMSRVTFDAVGLAGLDYDFGTASGKPCRIFDDYSTLTRLLDARQNSLVLQGLLPKSLAQFHPIERRLRTALRTVTDLADQVVRHRVEERDTNAAAAGKRRDLLSVLLQGVPSEESGGRGEFRLSAAELQKEVNLFLFAGHDTTSTALTFLWYELSRHPEAEKRVLEEIARNDLDDMPFTMQCIRETLRLYSPVPGVVRETTREETFLGHTVPPGTPLVLAHFYIHRNPAFWGPEPNKWDPDHFSPERAQARPATSWMPFALGARNCIGMGFSLLEMRAVLATLLPRWKATPVTTARMINQLILVPDNVTMRIEPR